MSVVLSLLCKYVCLDIAQLIINYCWKSGYPHCLHGGNYEEYFDLLHKNNLKVSVPEFESACKHGYHDIIEQMFEVGFQKHPTYYLKYACIYNYACYVAKLLNLGIDCFFRSQKDIDYVNLHYEWYNSFILVCRNGNLEIVKLFRPSFITDINDGIIEAKKYTKNNYKGVIEHLNKCSTNYFWYF